MENSRISVKNILQADSAKAEELFDGKRSVIVCTKLTIHGVLYPTIVFILLEEFKESGAHLPFDASRKIILVRLSERKEWKLGLRPFYFVSVGGLAKGVAS